MLLVGRVGFLSRRERDFVDAARVSGARDRRIIFRHILPNAVGVIVVNAPLLMAGAILLESALSYLGSGVQNPDTSLGKIVSERSEERRVGKRCDSTLRSRLSPNH